MTACARFVKLALAWLLALVMVAGCIPCFRPASSAYADIAMPDQANEGNLVLVVRFSDQVDRDTYNSVIVGQTSSWQSTMAAFDSDFKNYVGTVSRGKLNVQSVFPQDNNGHLEYLDLDISSTYFASLDNDLYLRDGVIAAAASRAFNAKYPDWDASQVNLDGKPAFIDNVMILVDTDLDVTTGLRSNMNRLAEGYQFGSLPMQDVEVIHATRAGANLGGAIDAVPAHEYLHRLGAKDLYRNGRATVDDEGNPIGELCDGWDMMATARRSLLPLAQTAADMGFLDIPTVASSTGTYEFELGTYVSDDASRPHAVAVKSPLNDSEYFVLEYRQGNLPAVNGYKADMYMGGKLSYDDSGAYDGVVISRVNTAVQEKTNGVEDYLYVFRPGDSANKGLGGDGKADTYKNASIKAGGSFGSPAVSDGIEQNALCYTDGTNSRIVVSVESAGSGAAKVKVEIPDYSDQSPWNVVKGSDGSSSFSAGSYAQYLSLTAAGDRLWGVVSDYSGPSKVISSDGSSWSIASAGAGSLTMATAVSHDGKPVVVGASPDCSRVVVRTLGDDGLWAEQSVQASCGGMVRAFSRDGSLFVAVADGDRKSVSVYNATDGFSPVGQQLSFSYAADACVIDSTHIVVADFFASPASVVSYRLENGAWVKADSTAFSGRTMSAARVGDKTLLFVESSSSDSAGRLYDVSGGSMRQLDFDMVGGGATAKLTSDGSSFYLNVLEGTSSGLDLTVYSSPDGTSWKQLGDTVKAVSSASEVAFCAGKAHVLTASSAQGYADAKISLRSHESAPAAGFYEVSTYKSGSDPSAWTHPERYGYAFAGWYADEACTQVYEATAGFAYARFVPASELVRYQGVSLKDDCYAEFGYDRSTLRFCYAFDAPAGCSFSSAGWDWRASWNGASGSEGAKSRWLSGGDGAIANLGIVKIARKNYAKPCSVRGRVSYVTPDGTSVEVSEPSFHEETVQQAASDAVSGGAATQAEKDYATGVLGELPISKSSSASNAEVVSLMDVSGYKGSPDSSVAGHPLKDGYAFAGWYSDEACTQVYEATAGFAYARFVPASELVRYQGVSLKDDCYAEFGYDRSTLRFCYAFDAPAGCSFSSAGWDWRASWNGASGSEGAKSRWLSGGDGAIANLGIVKIARKNYAKPCSVRGRVSYVTPDGTSVEVSEPSFHEETVQQAASDAVSGGAATQAEKDYASGILS